MLNAVEMLAKLLELSQRVAVLDFRLLRKRRFEKGFQHWRARLPKLLG